MKIRTDFLPQFALGLCAYLVALYLGLGPSIAQAGINEVRASVNAALAKASGSSAPGLKVPDPNLGEKGFTGALTLMMADGKTTPPGESNNEKYRNWLAEQFERMARIYVNGSDSLGSATGVPYKGCPSILGFTQGHEPDLINSTPCTDPSDPKTGEVFYISKVGNSSLNGGTAAFYLDIMTKMAGDIRKGQIVDASAYGVDCADCVETAAKIKVYRGLIFDIQKDIATTIAKDPGATALECAEIEDESAVEGKKILKSQQARTCNLASMQHHVEIGMMVRYAYLTWKAVSGHFRVMLMNQLSAGVSSRDWKGFLPAPVFLFAASFATMNASAEEIFWSGSLRNFDAEYPPNATIGCSASYNTDDLAWSQGWAWPHECWIPLMSFFRVYCDFYFIEHWNQNLGNPCGNTCSPLKATVDMYTSENNKTIGRTINDVVKSDAIRANAKLKTLYSDALGACNARQVKIVKRKNQHSANVDKANSACACITPPNIEQYLVREDSPDGAFGKEFQAQKEFVGDTDNAQAAVEEELPPLEEIEFAQGVAHGATDSGKMKARAPEKKSETIVGKVLGKIKGMMGGSGNSNSSAPVFSSTDTSPTGEEGTQKSAAQNDESATGTSVVSFAGNSAKGASAANPTVDPSRGGSSSFEFKKAEDQRTLASTNADGSEDPDAFLGDPKDTLFIRVERKYREKSPWILAAVFSGKGKARRR